MKPLMLAAIAGYGAAAIWVLSFACGAPEEDGCASAGSTTLYVLMVGTPLVLLLLGAYAAVGLLRARLNSDASVSE